MEKRTYYQRTAVVDSYEKWRFGSKGGRHVHQRELQAIVDALGTCDRQAAILDLPTGTGRVARELHGRGFLNLTLADASPAMLRDAAKSVGGQVTTVETDAFATSFDPAQFDAVLSVRFLFHFPEVRPLLDEVARILKPGGLWIFDTLQWSPRSILPRLQEPLGGLVFIHRAAVLEGLLKAAGFTVVSKQPMLLLPSLVYRFLPGPVVPLIDRLEEKAPDRCLSKLVWCVQKTSK